MTPTLDDALMVIDLLLASTFDAFRLGQLTGALVVFLPLLFGIVKCVLIMRRSSASTLCVGSLLMVFIAFLVTAVPGSIIRIMDWTGESKLWLLPSVLGLFIHFGALIVAVIGLSMYGRRRPPYFQGRAQAIWAMVLASLSMIGITLSLAAKLVPELSSGSMAGQGKPAGPISQPENGFRFTPPGAPWIEWPEIQKSNPLVTLGLQSRLPEAYFLIVPETLPERHVLSTPNFLAAIKQNLEQQGRVRRSWQEEHRVNGRSWVRLVTQYYSNRVNMEMHDEHWCLVTTTHAYQLATFGRLVSQKWLEREARQLVQGFEITNGAVPLAPDAEPGSAIADVQMSDLGYSTHLGIQGGWRKWDTLERDLPMAHFGALHAEKDAAMIVASLPLPDTKQEPAKLVSAFMVQLGFDPRISTLDTRPILHRDWAGAEVEAEREVDRTPMLYYARLVVIDSQAVITAMWGSKSRIESHAWLRTKLQAGVDIETPVSPDRVEFSSAQKNAQAEVFNQIALVALRGNQHDEAIRNFRFAVRLSPESSVYAANLIETFEQKGETAAALGVLAELPSSTRESDAMRQREARLLHQAGRLDEASTLYRALFATAREDPDLLNSYLSLLLQMNDNAQAVRVIDLHATRYPSETMKRWQANIYSRAGRWPEARALYLALLKVEKPDVQTLYGYGDLCNANGDYDEALKVSQRLLDMGEKTARCHLIAGWSHLNRKWYREAKNAFTEASALEPNLPEVKEGLLTASAWLGEGTNSDIKTPLAALPLPDAFAPHPAIPGDLADTATKRPHAARILRDLTGYHWQGAETPLRSTQWKEVAVHDTTGVSIYSTIEVPYQPVSERIYVNSVEVLSPTGEVLSTGKIDDYYVMDDRRSGMATHDKVLHIQVPGLKPGTLLRTVITRENLAKRKTFPFKQAFFGREFPAEELGVFVTGAVDEIQARHQGGMRETRKPGLGLWRIEHRPGQPMMEPYRVPFHVDVPWVALSGAQATWKTEVAEYLTDIGDRLKPDKTISELAARLTEGKTDDLGKLSVLARHVQKEIDYKAIEFGIRGVVPNACTKTLANRYGDCKDMSVLLHGLLQASGIKAHLALLNVSTEVVPELASLDQFNHAVVFVPGLRDGCFVDCTAKTLDVSAHMPGALAVSEQALIIDADKPRLIPLPQIPDHSATMDIDRRVEAMSATDVKVVENVRLTGYSASWLRSVFQGSSPADRKRVMAGLFRGLAAPEISEFDFPALDDPTQVAAVRLEYTLRNVLTSSPEGARGSIPQLWERTTLEASPAPDRASPWRLWYPATTTSETTYAQASASPSDLKSLADKQAWGEWQAQCEKHGNDVRLHLRHRDERGDHSATSYAEFVKSRQTLFKTLEPPLTFGK